MAPGVDYDSLIAEMDAATSAMHAAMMRAMGM